MSARHIIRRRISLAGIAFLAATSACTKKAETPAAVPATPAPVVSAPAPKPPPRPKGPNDIFDSPWQEESQFVVQTIATDLAEMIFFAKSGRLPDAASFLVEAKETGARPDGTLLYGVHVQFAADTDLTLEIPIAPAIWSPACYEALTKAMMGKLSVALRNSGSPAAPDELIEKLTNLRAADVEHANEGVSAELAKDFLNPAAHERAAFVLAAFALRDHSGIFFEIRHELCRTTAHLALARVLREGAAGSTAGRLAEIAELSLYQNQVEAMRLLEALPVAEPGVAAWQRALRTRNTGDYRIIHVEPETSRLERLEKFQAETHLVGAGLESINLQDGPNSLAEKTDWFRIVSSFDRPARTSVETGHVLLDNALGAEVAEIAEVHAMMQEGPLTKENFIGRLNAEPADCVENTVDGQARVRIISWGLWASFLQRHLCHAIQEDFNFMQNRWGVPEEARAFRAKVDAEFGGLRLYPFVRRQNATDEPYYHQAQDDSMALLRHSPEYVPALAWNNMTYAVPFGPTYIPAPQPFINSWFRANHNPPPGTAYDSHSRMNHPSLMGQSDTVARLERMHALAPWNPDITYMLLRQRFGENVPAAQLTEGYHAILEYDPECNYAIALASKGQPDAYLEWIKRAAELDPTYYYEMADYLVAHKRPPEAATAFADAFARDRDPVRVSNRAEWLVEYFETHGEPENATALANRAAESYSARGLQTKARLLEHRKDYDGAFEIYDAIAERYEDLSLEGAFLSRMQKRLPAPGYQALLNKALKDVPGKGLQKIDLPSLSGDPLDGVIFPKENEETKKWGLRPGDIVVGVQGYRIHNTHTYTLLRELDGDGPLRLVLWRSGTYLELTASPPKHRFGGDVRNYAKGR